MGLTAAPAARSVISAAVFVGAALLLPAAARAESGEALEVVLVKRAGVTAYEEATEEFEEHCRVRARVVSFGDGGAAALRAHIRRGALVVAVGQEALDAVAGAGARTIPALAFHAPGLVGPPSQPPPEVLLRVLRTARPNARTVGVVYGPRSEAILAVAQRAAERLGLQLAAVRAQSGPQAVRRLRELVEAPGGVDALWLPGDTDVVTPQAFQYALQLQLERGLPVLAATRQQVLAGALLAVDFNPRAAGRVAAEMANRILAGQPAVTREEMDVNGGARISVNSVVARRLGIAPPTVAELERLGARIE